MKHICLTVNVLVITVLLSAPGCTSSKSRHEGEGCVYDEKNGFSIIPPSEWENKGEFMGSFMVFIGPQEGEFTVNFNVNVLKHDESPIEKAESEIKVELERVLTNYEFVYDGFIDIDGRKCYYISSRFTMGVFRLQNLQYCILTEDKKKVYSLTFTASAETFDKYKSIFEKTALTAQTD